jgi:pyruvate dehydrogenase E2 component (dihydrolipoamide acetyltransferase)
MRRALEWLDAWNGAHAVTERLLHGVLLIKAVASALEKVPELNGFWRGGRFEPGDAINVGTAIRLRAGGLVAPALSAANRESLPSLMRRFQDLVQRARSGKLRATELTSATITVSSLAEGRAGLCAARNARRLRRVSRQCARAITSESRSAVASRDAPNSAYRSRAEA